MSRSTTWICRRRVGGEECGHVVISESRPEPIRWTDGHVCRFEEKKPMTKTNEKALDRFVAVVAEIRTTLEALQEAADDHFDVSPDEVHWGHVGDVQRTLEGLKEILAVVRGEVK